VKIASDGEILVRGKNLFTGYLHAGDATKDALGSGWLHTGDVGVIDDEGFLTITDRKKDLIITAGGKNVAPQNIENLLRTIPLVSHAVCIGDNKRFISALLTLNQEAVASWAKERGKAPGSRAEQVANAELRADLQKAIDALNERLARVEQVRKFTILEVELSTEGGELTGSMKIKRKVVQEKFKAAIEAMYA